MGAAALAAVAWAAAGTPEMVRRFAEPCPAGICADFERPTPATVRVLAGLGTSPTAWALLLTLLSWLLLLLSLAVAAVLLRRPPLCPLPVATSALLVTASLAPYTGSAREWLRVVVAALVVVFLGQFPSGSWSPAWLRWLWLPLVVLMGAAQAPATAWGSAPGVHDALAVAEGAVFVGLAAAQVHRFWRVSGWAARQQTKWPLLGLVLLAAVQVVAAVAAARGALAAVQALVVLLDYAGTVLLTAGVGLALLRHRLWDVDLLLRRTALSAAVTVALVVAYAALVAGASLAVSGSTTPAPSTRAAVVGGLAVAAGLSALGLRGWARRVLVGSRATPGATAAALARSLGPDGASATLASTIAGALVVPHVAVLDEEGRTVSEVGAPPGPTHTETVVGPAGVLGAVRLSPPDGRSRLSRADHRALAEVLPFVALVLRARAEADELARARAQAATSREDERLRLRRDLHDGVGPLLASQLLALDALRGGPADGALVDEVEGSTRSAIAEVRRIARDLRPAALDVGGLPVAVRAEAARFTRAGLPVEVTDDLGGGAAGLPAAVEVAALRVVQESLANAARHAGATSCRVALEVRDGALEVRVSDDGRGRGAATDGVGTASMRRRAGELGGALQLEEAPGGGTLVRAVIPL